MSMVTVVVVPVVVRRRFDSWRVGRGEMVQVCFEFLYFSGVCCVRLYVYVFVCDVRMYVSGFLCLDWVLVSTLRGCVTGARSFSGFFGTAFGSDYMLGV